MVKTVDQLQFLQQQDYDIFSFTEYSSSPNSSFETLFIQQPIPLPSITNFHQNHSHMISILSNQCTSLFNTTTVTSQFPIHNDGLLYLCLKELNKYCLLDYSYSLEKYKKMIEQKRHFVIINLYEKFINQ